MIASSLGRRLGAIRRLPVTAFVAASALAFASLPAGAQRSITPFATGAVVEHRVRLDGEVERVAGAVWGAGAAVAMNDWLSFRARLASGTLSARTSDAESRSLTEGEATVILVPDRWISLDAGIGVRTMQTSLARQRWIELRTGAELGIDIIDGSLRGVVQLSLAPSVSVSGQRAPNLAIGAGTGLEYSAGRLQASLGYTLDRYDFPADASSARLEQRSVVTARVGWRVR
jgi:hypothetical protein